MLTLMEARAVAEMAALSVVRRTLGAMPEGDGHPVLVLPGLMSSDWSSRAMRRFLGARGYAAYGWGLGTNRGPRGTLETDLAALLNALADRHGRKVSLIGTSLGGIYARQLAKAFPHLTRSVITLGSPFAGSPRATRAWRVYEWASGHGIDACDRHMGGRLATPPPVPTTAIYSRTDGICAWQCCVEQNGPLSESVEVRGSHLGLTHNPQVFRVLADRLAQAEGRFRPYRAPEAPGPVSRALAAVRAAAGRAVASARPGVAQAKPAYATRRRR
ncbi:esterase/lipase family protein [Phreatobacter sp.]|uniref:esterase/lipase family protein n=1 Tax=Phreatobacter sp. TaxID=1966341 RepID=UPI003F7228CA